MIPLMTEEYWRNSQFSIASYYGGCIINNESYKVVNKHGITVEELSDPNSPHYVGDGETKAIQPGEPCDLVSVKWIPVYKKLGREKLIELLKNDVSLDEAKRIAKTVNK